MPFYKLAARKENKNDVLVLFELASELYWVYCLLSVNGSGYQKVEGWLYQCNNDFAKVQIDIYYIGIDKHRVLSNALNRFVCGTEEHTRVIDISYCTYHIFHNDLFQFVIHKKSFTLRLL